MNRELCLQCVQELVDHFRQHHTQYTRAHSDYNETQVRVDFVNPLLEALGWDVNNQKKLPQHLREVLHEDAVGVEEGDEIIQKNPDYAVRAGTERKFFIEVKRPSVAIATARQPAFQLRRYGWNARLGVSLLTNFDKLVVYDCHFRPKADDEANIARIRIYDYTEYITLFDEIYARFSREAVYSGHFDQLFGVQEEREGTEPFDAYFLRQIEFWRESLARDLVRQNSHLKQDEVNYLVQRLINRIVFLRICEDRELENYRELHEVKTYEELKALFTKADEKYNSGLFDFIEDRLSLQVAVSDEVLVAIFRELYYPESPYAFSVVDPSVLGEIYDLFLAKQIQVQHDQVTVIVKPEVVASQGVVPTPKYVVDEIISRTLGSYLQGKSLEELATLRLADISCGSGSFLLAAYEYLLNKYLECYINEGVDKHPNQVYQRAEDEWRLTLAEKQRILLTHIYGVDIDLQAVEVTLFSLLLKVLENEYPETITAHLQQHHCRALPDLAQNLQCGNSLTDSRFFDYYPSSLAFVEQMEKINPLDWNGAFPEVIEEGGFDIIIGNPPYIRIQNMVQYSPDEVAFYQSNYSPYFCARSDNFDKYNLFIERGLSLLKPAGQLGFIVPHKFFVLKSGRSLRRLLSNGHHVREIVHFGHQQVFGNRRTTYTCILGLNKQETPTFSVEHVADIETWRRGQKGVTENYEAGYITEEWWKFVPPSVRALFDRIQDENPLQLVQVADIFVGVQTSADRIFIFHPLGEDDDKVFFRDRNGQDRRIERAILRPCLLDVEFQPFGSPDANSYIIFPYHMVDTRPILYTQEEMQALFPLCWDYLISFQEMLMKRSIQSFSQDTWYRYGRSQSLTQFNGEPKLIWPVLSLEPRYNYDDHDIVFTGGGNGPYYGLRPLANVELSIRYLQAILSHPVIEAMVRVRGSSFQGGYQSHGRQFMVDLPIRTIDFSNPKEVDAHEAIVRSVELLTQVTRSLQSKHMPNLMRAYHNQHRLLSDRIKNLVSSLYNLSKNDIKTIEPFLLVEKED